MKHIILATPIAALLIGCGGGGSTHHSYSNVDTSKPEYLYSIEYDPNADEIDAAYYEIINGKIDGRTGALGTYILTENKLYTPSDWEDTVIHVNKPNSWTIKYLDEISTDIQFDKIDLSNKNIYDVLFPSFRAYFKQNPGSTLYPYAAAALLSAGKATFPKDSFCYSYAKMVQNKPYLEFTTESYDEIDESFSTYQNFLKFQHNPGINTYFSSNKWQNISWAALVSPLDSEAAVQYNNRVYYAEYFPAQTWTKAETIKEFENYLVIEDLLTETEGQNLKFSLESHKTGCTIFNETAAKTITDIKLLNLR